MLALGRLITALVSPFTDDGTALDTGRLERLVLHVLDGGSDGLLVGGTTGEGPTLTDEELETLIREVRRIAPATVGVMANVGTNSTQVSIARARMAEAAGANSLLVVCPYYNKPPQEGLVAHYLAIAAATSLPVMIYNIPGRTAVNMLPETVAQVAREAPTVVAIKEASGDLGQMEKVVGVIARGDFHLWSGDDGLLADVMALGGVGVVSVLSHIAGPELRAIMDASLAGDAGTARSRQERLDPVAKAAFCTTNPIPIKAMLNAAGIPVGPCRLPLVEPTASQRTQILQGLDLLASMRAGAASAT
ncbi:MAG TPA: 4-hydroxy-tetrahydrodipicolinate synthase [bacterium]|nr:4-hydroxy-tetrahydrodipicolinate synthase [bacterium]